MKRMLLSMVAALGLTGCAATSDLSTDYLISDIPQPPE